MDRSDIYTTFCDTVKKRNLIPEGTGVLAAVSGGADSVAMLILLKKYLGEGKLGAAHFNHCLRGEESDRDELYVKKLCEENGIPLYTGRKDIAALSKTEKTGLEECARKYRYEFLKKTAAENGYGVIGIAHNSGDNAETVLLHFLRGCGPDGLCGLRYKSDNIIRPMLDIDRNDIVNFLETAGIPYVTDSTNSDNSYLRNRIRNEILPYLSEKLGYDVGKVLVRQTGIASAERDYIEEAAETFAKANLETLPGGLLLRTDGLKNENEAILRRAVRIAISTVAGPDGISPYSGRKDIESAAVDRALSLILSGKKGKTAQCGKDVEVKLTHSGALFTVSRKSRVETVTETHAFSERVLTPDEASDVKKKTGFRSGKRTVYFDKDKYSGIIERCGLKRPEMRRYRAGDRIVPFGMSGTKTVQKCLIDKKIPSEQRKTLWMLAAGDEILWIPGIISSALLAVDAGTKTVIEITVREED